MAMTWINAAAWWGLALVAVPIAIHLLVRQQTRIVAYPSLRFVRETALAAFRRRAIQDAVLLACRAAIVVAAVAALAGPILQTESRQAGHDNRVSRAIVQLDDSVANEEELTVGSFRSATFRRAAIADALTDAARWLDAQPPSSREVVFVGAFRKGQIAREDLLALPSGIGVRFAEGKEPRAGEPFMQRTLKRLDGRLVFVLSQVRLSADSTHVGTGGAISAGDDRIRVVAAAKDQPLADAALSVVLDAGIRWPDPQRRLVVVWEGADIAAPGASDGDVVRMAVPDPPPTAATTLRDAIDAATPMDAAEPIRIAQVDLDAWSRPAGPPSPRAQPADEGDRRWLWGAALLLLAAEYWLRRDAAQQLAQAGQEGRVA
jgi:hypothetical protein